MLNRALIKKSLREGAVLFLACAIGLFAFSFFRVWIVGRLDSNRFKQIIDLLPKDWDRYTSVDFGWLISYLGRVAMTLDEPMIIMIAALWGIVRGSDVVSGELGRGTLEVILAQPIKRSTVFWTHVVISIAGAVGLSCVVWLAMALAIEFTTIKETAFPELRIPLTSWTFPLTFLEPQEKLVSMRDHLHAGMFWPGVVNLACLSIFFVALTSWCSAWDRYRWRTLGIVVGLYFVMAMLKIGGLATDSFRFMLYLTFFSLHEPELHIRLFDDGSPELWSLTRWNDKLQIYELGPLGANAMLLILSAILLVWGARIFQQRDLPAPV